MCVCVYMEEGEGEGEEGSRDNSSPLCTVPVLYPVGLITVVVVFVSLDAAE